MYTENSSVKNCSIRQRESAKKYLSVNDLKSLKKSLTKKTFFIAKELLLGGGGALGFGFP